MYYQHNIDPVLLSLGPISIHWYGLMYVLGFAIAYFIISRQISSWPGKPLADFAGRLDNLFLVMILGLIIGARLGYVLFYNLSYYLNNPLEILATWQGGMSFHGGMIGLILGGWLFCRHHKLDFWRGADAFAVAVPLGLGLGRIGNFINGELFGRVSEVPWAVIFPAGGPLPRHPSQLYEALLEGPILFLLLWAIKNRYYLPNRWPSGSLFAIFVAGYGIARFVVEFFREPDAHIGFFFNYFTMGQLLCTLMIICAFVIWKWRHSLAAGKLLFILITGFLTITMQTSDCSARQLTPYLYKEKLDNGLTVIARETPNTGVATVQIWVRAGSVYEAENEGGITHFIEHMIFKGTPTRGPGEIAGEIEALGGRINAYTSYDHTVYHATLDSRHWRAALEVLSDALLNSLFDPDEMEREKQVIFEEISMHNERPERYLFQQMMSTAYRSHPYRLPIIGTRESVAATTRQMILDYVEKHYHPDNFVVVVVGDVDGNEVIAESNRLLGELPRKKERKPVSVPQEEEQEQVGLFYEEKDINQAQLMLALPIPGFNHPDTAVLNVIANILGQSEAARLNEKLRHEQRLVYDINAGLFTAKDPGLFRIRAVLDSDNKQELIRQTLVELFTLRKKEVSNSELARAKRNIEADFVFNLESAEGLAQVTGFFEMLTGNPREREYIERIRAVSAADIIRVAEQYFNSNAINIAMLAPIGSDAEIDKQDIARLINEAKEEIAHLSPPKSIPEAQEGHIHSYSLRNGITLLVREQRGVPTVAIRAVFPGGLHGETPAINGAFAFLAELLPRGAGELDARQMAKTVADLAGEIDGFNGRNTFGISADFLARFFDQGLILVRDVIREPRFDPEEAEKIRAELLSDLRRQEDQLSSVAYREFNRALFLNHPYALNPNGSIGAISNLSLETLREVYHEYARPDRLVLSVAGDVDAAAVKLQVEELFADWPPRPADAASIQEEMLPPEPPFKPEIVNISREREQTHVIIGFIGTTLTSDDRYAIEVLDQVLSGMSGRLFSELRDRLGLAYSVTSFSLTGTDTGSLGVYIGTSPDRRDEAIREIWSQLYRVRSEPVSATELTRAKNVLISRYLLSLQSNGARAMDMALNQTYQLGLDFFHRYPERIEAVSAADVMAAARQYIDPERFVMVTVGASPSEMSEEQEEEESSDE